MRNNISINTIRKEINEWDPIDLLDIAPNDEYECEIKAIFDRLSKYAEIDKNIVSSVICVVFAREFGSTFTNNYNTASCVPIAEKIIGGE